MVETIITALLGAILTGIILYIIGKRNGNKFRKKIKGLKSILESYTKTIGSLGEEKRKKDIYVEKLEKDKKALNASVEALENSEEVAGLEEKISSLILEKEEASRARERELQEHQTAQTNLGEQIIENERLTKDIGLAELENTKTKEKLKESEKDEYNERQNKNRHLRGKNMLKKAINETLPRKVAKQVFAEYVSNMKPIPHNKK